MALIGNMPGHQGGSGGTSGRKINWISVIELAQAHPGTPVVHDEFQEVADFRKFASLLQSRDDASKKHPERVILNDVLAEMGGQIQVWGRKVRKGEGNVKEIGNVWIMWTPLPEEGKK